MTNSEKIQKLTALWYKCLVDHHKDRDCHFLIELNYQYDGQLIYYVNHYGYVANEFSGEFHTLEAAEKFLIKNLIKQINKEALFKLSAFLRPENGIEKIESREYWEDILSQLTDLERTTI